MPTKAGLDLKEYNRRYYKTQKILASIGTEALEDDRPVDGLSKKEKTPKLLSKASMRKLTPFAKLSDDEFDDLYAKMEMKVAPSKALEKRIDIKLNEFANDYDISDLKINDKLVLRALVQALLQLEDLEQYANTLREGGMEQTQIAPLREINLMMAVLRKDISSMQEDLKITRKHRKGDKEQNAIAYLDDLKAKAKEFYKSAMTYVYCPNCHQLLMTFWILYPEEKKNRIKIYCNNVLGNGDECGAEILVNMKEVVENKTLPDDNVPESLN